MSYKLSSNELEDLISVCEIRTFCKQPCRRCKYDGEPCKQAKEHLMKEVYAKIQKGEARPFEYNDFLDNKY